MSLSPLEPAEPPGHAELVANASPGVLVQVFDAQFRPVASGMQALRLFLEEGLYNVRFTAAGQSEDKVVRLLPINRPLIVSGGELSTPSASPSATPNASPLEKTQAAAVARWGRALQPHRVHGQDVVIFVRAPDDRTRSDVARSLKLLDQQSTAMRSDPRDEEADATSDPVEGWAARRYGVEAGCFSILYQALSRKKVQQTTYAFGGRRTFVFLEYGATMQLEQSGERFRQVSRRGVDASRTVMVSEPEGTPAPSREKLRLADMLLHALAEPMSPLDPTIIENLLNSGDCPYLLLYAAAALAIRLELGQEEGQSSPTFIKLVAPTREARLPPALVDQALGLLNKMPVGDWPDVHCIRWRLESLRSQFDGGVLCAPPLLDWSWRWAAAYSVERPGALPPLGSISAAGQDRERAAPWLAWRSAAARPGNAKSAYSKDQLRPAIEAIVSLVGPSISPPSADPRQELEAISRADKLYSSLSLDTQQTANAVQTMLSSSLGGNVDAQGLASLLSAPLAVLGEKLQRAAVELDQKAFKP